MKKESRSEGEVEGREIPAEQKSGNQMSGLRSKWISEEAEEGEFRMKRLACLQAGENKAASKEG